jgi:XTP/dITP diphosphohydrolase
VVSEKKRCTDVCLTAVIKLINRHPHIYGNVTVRTEADVKEWETHKTKRAEKKKSVLEGVPKEVYRLWVKPVESR